MGNTCATQTTSSGVTTLDEETTNHSSASYRPRSNSKSLKKHDIIKGPGGFHYPSHGAWDAQDKLTILDSENATNESVPPEQILEWKRKSATLETIDFSYFMPNAGRKASVVSQWMSELILDKDSVNPIMPLDE